jgi:hypothetical protein
VASEGKTLVLVAVNPELAMPTGVDRVRMQVGIDAGDHV